jgi:hypothetical protein
MTDATQHAPGVLFVPASGASGAGEYYRCVAIARGVERQWPHARIRFVVSRDAGYAHDVPFATSLVEGTPTFNTRAVNRVISESRADVVVFDSAGRVAQLAHASRCGAANVYVSSRPKARWKGFRLRRMRHLDQHWLAWPRFLGGDLSLWERFKLGLMHRPEIVFLDPLLPARDAVRELEYRRQLGLEGRKYLLVSAGGGGHERAGVPAAEILVAAAAEVSRATGHVVVWVRGPNYRGDWEGPAAVVQLAAVTPPQMLDLLAGADVAMINGGSLLLQALAVRTVCIAAPIAGDQPRRIDACARLGLVISAHLDTASLASATRALLSDPDREASIRSRLQALALGNGVDQAVDALARLLARRRVRA